MFLQIFDNLLNDEITIIHTVKDDGDGLEVKRVIIKNVRVIQHESFRRSTTMIFSDAEVSSGKVIIDWVKSIYIDEETKLPVSKFYPQEQDKVVYKGKEYSVKSANKRDTTQLSHHFTLLLV
jgi:hypothetical protein